MANVIELILKVVKEGTGAEDVAKDLDGVKRSAKAAGRELVEFSREAKGVGIALSGMAVAGTAVIRSTAMVAARNEELGFALATVGRNAGYTEGQLARFEESTKDMGITTSAARQSMMMMAQAQIDLAHSADLARLAQDAAVIAGRNSSETYRDLIAVIQTGNTRMARNMGLTVSWQQAYEDFAVSAGKSVAALTEQEKIQARTNHVMEQGAAITGTYEAAMDSAYKKMGSLARHWETAQENLGEAFVPAMGFAIDAATDLLEAFNDLEEEQHRVIAGFLGVGTAIAGMSGAAILAIPQLHKTYLALKALKGAMAGIALLKFAPAIIPAGQIITIRRAGESYQLLADALRDADGASDVLRVLGHAATMSNKAFAEQYEHVHDIDRAMEAYSERLEGLAGLHAETTEDIHAVTEGWEEYGGQTGIIKAKTRVAGEAHGELLSKMESAAPITDAYNEKMAELAEANRIAASAAAELAGETANLAERLFEATEAQIASQLIGMLDPEQMGAEAYLTAATEIGTAFGIMDDESIALAENLPKVAEALNEGIVPAEEAAAALEWLVGEAADGNVEFEGLLEKFGNLPEPAGNVERKMEEMGIALEPLPGLTNETGAGIERIRDGAKGAASNLGDMNSALRNIPIVDMPRGYQSGTHFYPGGWALMGEGGPELAQLPRGSRIYNATETRSIINRGGDSTNRVNWTGDIIVQGGGDPRSTAQAVMRELQARGIFSGAALR